MMDKESFCTDFHPADCGILEAVGRVLGAGFLGEGGGLGVRAIKGEIYKLNVRGGFHCSRCFVVSCFGGEKRIEVASVLRRANVAKPLRVSALLTSQRTGGTSECKPL